MVVTNIPYIGVLVFALILAKILGTKFSRANPYSILGNDAI